MQFSQCFVTSRVKSLVWAGTYKCRDLWYNYSENKTPKKRERTMILMNENSKGFCIFYDWLEVFGLLTREQAGDLLFAIADFYLEGTDMVSAVSAEAKPIAMMIMKQIERAKINAERKKVRFKRANSDSKTETKTKTETETETTTKTETETKTKTETETTTKTETETETETEKTKETKQNTHTHAASLSEVDFFGGGGGEREEVSGFSSGFQDAARPIPTAAEVEKYVRECGLVYVNPMQFYDYNMRRGWEIDGEPIRDWQSVITIWNAKLTPPIKEERGVPTRSKEAVRYGGFDPEEAFERALRRSYGDEL